VGGPQRVRPSAVRDRGGLVWIPRRSKSGCRSPRIACTESYDPMQPMTRCGIIGCWESSRNEGENAMSVFKRESGDWVQFRELPDLEECDLHFSQDGPRTMSFQDNMEATYNLVLRRLQSAHENGNTKYLLIRHGESTSRRGNTTSRSQVRKLMRSSDATPYIIRKDCIQHPSVFLANIKPRNL